MIEKFKDALSSYINLTAEQWVVVSGYCRHRSTKRNEILLDKGKVCEYMFFVLKGCLRVFLIDDNGSESTRFLIFEGQFGTAFPSFVLQEPSVAAVSSIEASEILIISHHDYQALLVDMPGWETMMRIALEKAYIESIVRIEGLISIDARERYRILMEKNPKIIQRLPNKIVADYLGISQETLSRLKKRPKN